MKKNKIVNKSFVVIGSDGKPYKIVESTEMLDDSSFGVPEKYKIGRKSYSLSDGTKLNNIKDDKYEIMGTNVFVII